MPPHTHRLQQPEVGAAHPTALVKLALCQHTNQLISQFKSPRVAHTSPVPCRLATTPSPTTPTAAELPQWVDAVVGDYRSHAQ
jgi:hypothetical protein